MTAAERINQPALVPIMHWKKFAEVVGIEEVLLRGLCNRDHIPSIYFGKNRFINLAKINHLCLDESHDTANPSGAAED